MVTFGEQAVCWQEENLIAYAEEAKKCVY